MPLTKIKQLLTKIESKLLVEVTSFNARVFGSVLIFLSASLMFVYRFTWWEFESLHDLPSNQFLIWVFCQSFSPLLAFLITLWLRPFITSYLIYAYAYIIQLYWLLSKQTLFDDSMLHAYAAGSIVIICFVSYLLAKAKILENKKIVENKEYLKELEDCLNILRTKMDK